MTRPDDDFVHAGRGLRRYPVNVDGDQRAEAAHFAEQRLALHGVGPDRATVNRRGGRAETGKSQGDASNRDDRDGDVNDSFDLFCSSVRWSLYVHKSYRVLPKIARWMPRACSA